MSGHELSDAITGGIESVTKKWAKQRKAEERSAGAAMRRRQAMTTQRGPTIREAAFHVMEEAYLKASGNGRFHANARQVMYAARPKVLEITGGEIWSQDSYFTQQLLPDYIEQFAGAESWKIAYDARGHLVEPHRDRLSGGRMSVALGTLEVREYTSAEADDPLKIKHLATDFPTAGPEHRYSAVVFVEKEGFDQQISESGLADQYDVAFMSTKGMSNTASRELVDHLAGHGVQVLIVRDFDRAGFSIAGTLTSSSRRYRFHHRVYAIDLGLRLEDVQEYGLESEPWREKVSPYKVKQTLRRHGATDEEIDFLVSSGTDWSTYTEGQRVELNAFTADQFITWLGVKLDEHVDKIVPDVDTLTLQYRRALARQAVNKKIDEFRESARDEADQATVPDDLAAQVRDLLDDDPVMSWDEAVTQISADEDGGAE